MVKERRKNEGFFLYIYGNKGEEGEKKVSVVMGHFEKSVAPKAGRITFLTFCPLQIERGITEMA